jgi:hypothetical protein
MVQASPNRLVTKEELVNGNVTDYEGKPIKFTEDNEGGTFTSSKIETDGSFLTFIAEPMGEIQYALRQEKKSKTEASESDKPDKVGTAFKTPEKTKGQFVADYGTAKQSKK